MNMSHEHESHQRVKEETIEITPLMDPSRIIFAAKSAHSYIHLRECQQKTQKSTNRGSVGGVSLPQVAPIYL